MRFRERRARCWVYPRVGGETKIKRSYYDGEDGLSPRGRGNHLPQGSFLGVPPSIPAWAGKPPRQGHSTMSPTVYPRVGGETGKQVVVLPLL